MNANEENIYAVLHEFRNWNKEWNEAIKNLPKSVDNFVIELAKTWEVNKKLHMDNQEFKWDDALVKEFVRDNFNRQEHNYLPHAIEQFKASKQKPLLITHDNVKVFDGDNYWKVSDDFICTRQESSIGVDYSTLYTKTTFSTQDAANKYIAVSKPCFSAKELLLFGGSQDLGGEYIKVYVKQLTELAKSKNK